MPESHFILVAGALLASGVLASLLAWRLRIPGLVLFLGVGMLVGSDGLGLIDFDDYNLARVIGVIALALILFEGGLTSGIGEIRPVLGPSISLATLGTLATAAIVGVAAALLFDFSWLEGLLLGSIVASTDSAAIFALLRDSTLRRRLARTLEGEAGVNDPIAVLLVLGFIDWIQKPHYGIGDMAILFVKELGIGLAVGLVVGWLSVQAFRRVRLATAGLYPVASIAVAALAYGGAASIEGSGFLAVYIAGLALGSAAIPAKHTITVFHQGIAWVAQLAMFVVLGLLVFPSQLGGIAFEATVLTLVLMLVARPLGAAVATAPWGFSGSERAVLGWAGLRGAVPVVLATFPIIDGVPHAVDFFNIVFFAVVLSTLVQGSTFQPLARRLRLTTSVPALPRPLTEAGTIRRLGAEVLEFPIGPDDAIAGNYVRDLGLPRDAVVNVIVRGDAAIPPRGSTRLQPGDVVHVLVREESARRLRALVERWRHGPVGPPPRPAPERPHASPIFSSWKWTERDGDPGRPQAVRGQPVIERLRTRRDKPGALCVLRDGRYAVTGRAAAVGGREAVTQWALRRVARVESDERAWLQTVIGALAADRQR